VRFRGLTCDSVGCPLFAAGSALSRGLSRQDLQDQKWPVILVPLHSEQLGLLWG